MPSLGDRQFTWNGNLYWVVHLRDGGRYGPYVDHAHYAGLMEMTTPIPLVLAMTERGQKAQTTLLGFAALVMVGGLFFSLSRPAASWRSRSKWHSSGSCSHLPAFPRASVAVIGFHLSSS
nr:hypothetical protein Hi04_10k_c5966_00026 [uncultured bacterium]